MAPAESKKTITLLVTGMGPFQDAPEENISTTVARRLAGAIIERASHPNLQIRLCVSPALFSLLLSRNPG